LGSDVTPRQKELPVRILEEAVGQLLALIAFFAFPASQYATLKWITRKDGQPELWYVPGFGFRLVVRNIPRRRVLSDIGYRVLLRRVLPASPSASVATLSDRELVAIEGQLVLPGEDFVLYGFTLREGREIGSCYLAEIDAFGREQEPIQLGSEDKLICDYTATIQNFFNFDVQFGKRVEIDGSSFLRICQSTHSETERPFAIDRIHNIR
jgi:hypothetical protein